MLFNSYPFLLGFLPGALLIQAVVEARAAPWRRHSLLGLSLVFYGYWDWRFTPLLVLSIAANWAVSTVLARSRSVPLLTLTVGGNLAILGFYKYLGLLMQASNAVGLSAAGPLSFVLPLGISFFTFHHIMYLTDLRAERAPRLGLVDYALYISFFPQVLAGPLVRWRELVPQLARPCFRPGFEANFSRGLMLLTIGLIKKVFIGDALAGIAATAFSAAEAGSLTVGLAWQGMLAFSFQIYFDFSGYTDMALGTALMFGIVLPQNFAVPYRAADIADFWRRWHMTLSRFLRDYVYIPLGGNRRGLAVQLAALLATMTLGGLWHGAGVQFILWGLLQGLGLVLHVLWRKAGGHMPPLPAIGLTFLFVTLAWVLFRAPTLAVAMSFYRALFGAAPVGHFRGGIGLAAAALVALIGPTSWEAVHRARPTWLAAGAVACGLVAALLVLNDSGSYEFIYFRF